MQTTVRALAERLQGAVSGDPARLLSGVRSIDRAGPGDLSFAADERNLRKLSRSAAGAVLLSRADAERYAALAERMSLIAVDDTFAAFGQSLDLFRPPRPRPPVGLSRDAHVSPTARIGAFTNIFPGAHILDDVTIGESCDIHPGVFIGAGCRIGSHVTLHANAVLYADVSVGNRVTIHASAVIGADGFGYRLRDGKHVRIPHRGTVRIEDDVEIGACTTIDRAMIGETVIGEGTKIDNLVMIAHNCELGRHNILVSQVGFAGSVTTGDYVVCAGQVGIADHVHLGERAVLGSKAGVHKDVPGGQTYLGAPAMPAAETRRIVMAQQRLPELRVTVRALEQQVAELTRRLNELAGGPEESRSAA
ncbi:MAG TPA: UDP-3-O-(3-hydroxymyristoyl)glucosamine N-acyltransferase [Planctomycetaceae bacterium]|nr:UDP-3-O-(3-hydroxymyristoyl)glucosamine N-acyltransferase [Planctomycetaceae bacterium]